MTQEELNTIEKKLGIEFPHFYKNTMLNYPFDNDSFGFDCMLPKSPQILEDCNCIFTQSDKCLAIGSDGGEFTYYIKLNGEETVYIFDLEQSDYHHSIEANTWEDYLDNIHKIDKEYLEEEQKRIERKKNKKWWQFWI
tara:strand:+ start:657 stop:1070 length:414 start_codon:yes stop_codon:yes gene_type:complete